MVKYISNWLPEATNHTTDGRVTPWELLNCVDLGYYQGFHYQFMQSHILDDALLRIVS